MCGIVGYLGHREAAEVLISSLKKLEYRGYDSAGVAILGDGVQLHKDKGEIAIMESTMPKIHGQVGIGHTRWATCGKPSKENAHPFLDCHGNIAIVHNGIIENYVELKRALIHEGHTFTSETDTEVLVHLVEKEYQGDLREAVGRALQQVKGTYAIAVIMSGQNHIIASRKENPLVIGLGVGENFIASDVTALLDYTNKVLYLMDDETVELTAKKADIYDANGNRVDRRPELVTWTAEDAQKGGFEHFMLKEIYETPEAVNSTLLGNLESIETGEILPDLSFSSIKLVACGTSYHAAMIGKYILEAWTKLPVSVEIGSEFRYGASTKEQPLVILISQSGETADTLAAAREAKKRGCRTLAISNVVGSTITREVNEVLYTRAGPEIGVAATKTFVAQLAALYVVALRIAYGKRTMGIDSMRMHKKQLSMLPKVIREVLSTADQIEMTADLLADANHVFYLGRNINYPVMLEGALKIKEISYIHAEGYAAGELKHGPLALIDASTPVVAACVRDHTYDKMLSNISEVQARDSPVIAVGTQGDRDLESIANHVIFIPEVPPIFSPLPITVALQLLAYHTARKKGCPIDKPRNLAKSVTVE